MAELMKTLATITDAKGIDREYQVELVGTTPAGSRYWDFARTDTGEIREVTLIRPGDSWHCSCEDFTYRQRRAGGECKHILFAKENLMQTAVPDSPAVTQPVNLEPPVSHPLTIPEVSPATLGGIAQGVANGSAGPTFNAIGHGRLALALYHAQQKCKAVAHNARNNFQKYDYASADAIIGEAKAAMEGSELSLLPIEMTVKGFEAKGEDRFELHRKFLLLHSSGECLPVAINWPIVLEKGRPLEKATAIADTSSLAYLYRDLLQMPRVKAEDDMNADGNNGNGSAPAQADPELATVQDCARLETLIVEAKADRAKFLAAYGVPEMAAFRTKDVADAEAKLNLKIAALKPPPAAAVVPPAVSTEDPLSEETFRKIENLIVQLKIPWVPFRTRIKELFKTDVLSQLTELQGRQVADELAKSAAKKGV